MPLNSADVRHVMRSLAPGEYRYLETESQADSIRVSKLCTSVKALSMQDDPRTFATACGIAIMKNNQPQYFVRISAE